MIAKIIIILCISFLMGCQSMSPESSTPDLSQPKHIALLLPLSGPHANEANAIRRGFMTAFYQMKSQDPDLAPTLSIIDTYGRDINELYQEAVEQGASFVVGPLTKNDLAVLVAANRITVPTLALNTLASDDSAVDNLFQFGLSPLDEAEQIAQKAKDEGHLRFIIINPTGEWGEHLGTAFQKEWESLGGQLTAQLAYEENMDLNSAIYNLFSLDKSENRAQEMREALQEKFRFIAERRQDFDAIFLVANPEKARQIIPLLRFYYAHDIPVYAISSLYSGVPRVTADRDINGAIFADMPWVLSPGQLSPPLSKIRDRVLSVWPEAYAQNIRLYSLGVDAYRIIPAISHFSKIQDLNINGATGTLRLLDNHHVYRQLLWATMENGQPHLQPGN